CYPYLLESAVDGWIAPSLFQALRNPSHPCRGRTTKSNRFLSCIFCYPYLLESAVDGWIAPSLFQALRNPSHPC
ncbi:hypothetical protein, partial [Staphylococcus coagulans]